MTSFWQILVAVIIGELISEAIKLAMFERMLDRHPEAKDEHGVGSVQSVKIKKDSEAGRELEQVINKFFSSDFDNNSDDEEEKHKKVKDNKKGNK